jgi:hypothetical protein
MKMLEKMARLARTLVRNAVIEATDRRFDSIAWRLDHIDEQRRQRAHPVSVLLIAETQDGREMFASWSAEVAPGEARQGYFDLQLPVKLRWLIGLNGALLADARVGLEVLHLCPSLGPVVRCDAHVAIGIRVFFSACLAARAD